MSIWILNSFTGYKSFGVDCYEVHNSHDTTVMDHSNQLS